MIPDADAIARTIANEYPDEQEGEQLAQQLLAVGNCYALAEHLIAWLHDRPKHPLSTTAFLVWCERYGFVDPERKEQ